MRTSDIVLREPVNLAPVARAVAPGTFRCVPLFHDTPTAPLLEGLEGSPFQSPGVLAAFLATYAGRQDAPECFLLTLADPQGRSQLALPLVRRRRHGLRTLELMDAGVVDFTAPLVRPGAVLPERETLWPALKAALPGADLLQFRRLEPGRPGQENPLFNLPGTLPSPLVSWRINTLEPHETRQTRYSRSLRKKMNVGWRKFMALPGARVVVARDAAEGLRLLAALESLQGARIRAKGLDYGLDNPRARDFYRHLVEQGVPRGETLVSALMLDDQVLAASFAVLCRDMAVYLRVANDFSRHTALAPGYLSTEACMDEAQARGVRVFDFGMGSYRYKSQLGGLATPLHDLLEPLSPLGVPVVAFLRAKRRLAAHPLLRRLTGRAVPAQPEE